MEEIDKIIIDSLKHLECDIGEDIQSLKQFDADIAVLAISSCLELITPDTGLSKKLPPSMISRLKLASDMAQSIKNLGFRGDIGYQTILYCNEVELRRVLMFLIERLPREANKITPTEQTSYVSRIVKAIEGNIKESLTQLWVPHYIMSGIRSVNDLTLVNSSGNSSPIDTVNLVIPDIVTENEDLKHYWVHNIPEVTKQCPTRKLIPSLLFSNNAEFPANYNFIDVVKSDEHAIVDNIQVSTNLSLNNTQTRSTQQVHDLPQENSNKESQINALISEVNELETKYLNLQGSVTKSEELVSELAAKEKEEQDLLQNTLSKIKLKNKTAAILSKEENKVKLKALIQNAKDRLVELANQWNKIQTPLLDEYKMMQSSLDSLQAKLHEEQESLNNAKLTYNKLAEDLKEKSVLEQNLIHKCHQMSKHNHRSAYTQRILEIIGNIRKQSSEIQKVLKDTREIQKDINNLTGQVDRSFTLSDELIYYDARNDETARKSYKLLASLRDECCNVLKAVSEIGQAEREYRNLEEQIETEKTKEIATKLTRVYSDLTLIKNETKK